MLTIGVRVKYKGEWSDSVLHLVQGKTHVKDAIDVHEFHAATVSAIGMALAKAGTALPAVLAMDIRLYSGLDAGDTHPINWIRGDGVVDPKFIGAYRTSGSGGPTTMASVFRIADCLVPNFQKLDAALHK